MSKVGDYLIPFDKQGNQQHFASEYHGNTSEWRENKPFTERVVVHGMESGRSAKYLVIRMMDSDKRGTMFVKDLVEALPYFVDGVLKGTFRFTKRGQNYGIKYQA